MDPVSVISNLDFMVALRFIVATVVSIAVFELAVILYHKVKSPLLNPMLVTVIGLILALTLLHVPVETY